MQNTDPIGHNNPPTDAEILSSSLTEKHARILDGAAKLVDAANRIPEIIEDDETAGRAADYIKMVTGCAKNLEAERVSEKEPHLTMGRMVDGFFKKYTDALEVSKTRAKRPLDTWLKKKAAEEQRRRMEEAAQLRQKQEEEARAAQMLEAAKMQPEAAKMLDQATITEKVAEKIESSAQARPAEMAQVRGASGARAGLVTKWIGKLSDVQSLDLEALRFHINPEALQKAINSFVAAGGRKIHGAHIYEESDTVTR